MKYDVMKKWVKALRSGKYKQGKGVLKNNKNEYCCLGVLCDISGVAKESKDRYGFSLFDGYAKSSLPNSVKEYSGLKSGLGGFYNFSRRRTVYLANYNDSKRGKTFKEIADIIEKNWKKL